MNTHHHRAPLFAAIILFLLSTLLSMISISTATDSDNINNIEFIRTSCNTTLYSDLCYTTLSGYATTVQQNPSKLAKLAISISLSNARYLTSYFSNLTREADYNNDDHRAIAALHDCYSNLGNAVSEMKGSLKQMRQIEEGGGGGGSSSTFRFLMSNVQTWMSAALTDEDTCTEGFKDVTNDDTMKKDVNDRVVEVKMLTSNALALVNRYVEYGSSPRRHLDIIIN
ncbi:hypothetical protein ACFE04_019220 [Oxalis oulophora]